MSRRHAATSVCMSAIRSTIGMAKLRCAASAGAADSMVGLGLANRSLTHRSTGWAVYLVHDHTFLRFRWSGPAGATMAKLGATAVAGLPPQNGDAPLRVPARRKPR